MAGRPAETSPFFLASSKTCHGIVGLGFRGSGLGFPFGGTGSCDGLRLAHSRLVSSHGSLAADAHPANLSYKELASVKSLKEFKIHADASGNFRNHHHAL